MASMHLHCVLSVQGMPERGGICVEISAASETLIYYCILFCSRFLFSPDCSRKIYRTLYGFARLCARISTKQKRTGTMRSRAVRYAIILMMPDVAAAGDGLCTAVGAS